jgi:hypothetical protein
MKEVHILNPDSFDDDPPIRLPFRSDGPQAKHPMDLVVSVTLTITEVSVQLFDIPHSTLMGPTRIHD